MKKLILITSLLLSTSAFAGNISYKCQQGVGNRSNPDPILNIEGNLRKDASKTGEYSEAEKNQLKVTIFDGNSLAFL